MGCGSSTATSPVPGGKAEEKGGKAHGKGDGKGTETAAKVLVLDETRDGEELGLCRCPRALIRAAGARGLCGMLAAGSVGPA